MVGGGCSAGWAGAPQVRHEAGLRQPLHDPGPFQRLRLRPVLHAHLRQPHRLRVVAPVGEIAPLRVPVELLQRCEVLFVVGGGNDTMGGKKQS